MTSRMFEYKLEGEEKILKAIDELEERYPHAMAAAVYQDALEQIFTPSQEQCPVDEGRLRGSGRVEPPNTSETEPQTVISYNTDYAVPVHDNEEANHPVGKARFLIDPFIEAQSGMAARLAQRAKRNAERKVGISRLRTIKGDPTPRTS